MTVSNDRRKHQRVGFSTDIKILLDIDGKEVKLDGSSKDLSLKGIFVNTDQKFVLGTECLIRLSLTGSIENIELIMQGTFVRQTDTGIGIVFDSMDVDSYSHLKNIVMYNQADESE